MNQNKLNQLFQDYKETKKQKEKLEGQLSFLADEIQALMDEAGFETIETKYGKGSYIETTRVTYEKKLLEEIIPKFLLDKCQKTSKTKYFSV